MPRIGLLRDPRFRLHDTTPRHPESPERLRAIEDLLSAQGIIEACVPIAAREAADEELARVHSATLLAALVRADEAAREQHVFLDPDTVMSTHSLEAARLAAGGVVDAARALARGELDGAFCLPRPPGHHATGDRAMGFCLYNHVAVAAADLLALGAVPRVAVIDFDVHHGNGTQDIFYGDGRLLYCSTHQYPHYPGTGRLEETGTGAGAGTNLNLPLPPGCGDRQYLRCFDEVIDPAVRRYRPGLIFVSAGFDAHWRDPLADERLSGAGYRGIAERIAALSVELGAPVLYMLEGGYDLEGISWAVRHCIGVQLGLPPVDDPVGPAPGGAGPDIDTLLDRAKEIHRL